jgi:hypothetical protein
MDLDIFSWLREQPCSFHAPSVPVNTLTGLHDDLNSLTEKRTTLKPKADKPWAIFYPHPSRHSLPKRNYKLLPL